MKKKIFIISLISFFFVCLFSFTTINVNAQTKTQKEMVNEEIQNINLPEVAVIDFPLPTISVYDSTIVWEAEANQTYITISEDWAKVTRPTDENKTVTLTVTITNGAESASREFKVTVLKGKTITNTYSITYVLNGGTNNSLNPNSYNVGDELELYAPTNGEVKFLGWYMDPEFLGESYTKLPNGLTGDVTFYAKWEEAKATSIEVTKNPVLKYTAQQTFDPTGIEVLVVYSNGEKEVIDSKELVFSIEGQNDLVVHGNTKEVKVSYKEFTTSVKLEEVTKLQYNLEGLFEAQELVYNGKSQNYTLPTLPKGLTATTQGSAKEVGTVKVKVLFTNENVDYEQPQNIEVDLTITKANLVVKPIDVNVKVGAAMPTFKVTFTGLLGDDTESIFGDVVVTTDATDTNTLGEYTLTVKEFEAKNYNVIYQTGKLVVQESTYEIYVSNEQLNVVYNGKNQMFTAVIKDGEKVLTEITDITYEVNGFTFAGATNAGSYEVVVSYHHETYGDGKASVVFNIAKCEFDVNTVKFQNDILEYNGEEQNLVIEGTLPEGITVKYSQGATDVVTEKVIVATFEANENYTFKNGVKTLEAKLTIAPKELETSMFEVIKHQDYTGKEVTPEVKGSFKGESFNITADFTVVYVNNVNEGKATVKVTAKENTNFTGTVELTFQIGKTPLVKVQEAAKELDDKYEALELPENFVVETTNGSSVFWLSTNTGLTIDAKGNISMIQTSEEYYVLVYALITYEGEEGTAAEYTAHVFIVPALGNTEPDTPVVPKHEHTECPTCGLCTSEDCDGTAEQKCQGHTQEPEQLESEKVDFSAQGYTNAQEVSKLDLLNANLVFDKGSNSSYAPKYYDTGTALRLYGGNTLTITSANKIVKVELTFSSGEGTNNIIVSSGTYSDGIITISEGTNELVLTIEGTSGHRRIKTITVHYYSANGEQPDEPDTPVVPTTSTITYVLDGGTNPENAPTTYVEGTGLNTLPQPTKEGYTFLGWYDGETKVESISKEQTGNLTLTAKWEEEQSQDPEQPVETFPYENKDYNLVIDQKGVNKTLYFTGVLSGNFAATTTNVVEAAIFNVIKVEGGFNLYVKSNNTYLNAVVSGSYNNIKFENSPSSVWTYDSEKNAIVTMCGTTKVFIGTYNSYETGSLSDYNNYIDSTTNYRAYLEEAKEVTDADKLALDKESLSLPTQTISNLTLPTSGKNGSVVIWTTSNANAITTTGVVTRGTEDVKVVLTATLTLGENKDTKEFEVVVLKEVVIDPDQPSEEVTATITFDNVNKRTELSTTKQVWFENGITITGNKAKSTNDVANYSNPARFYQASELVVSVEGTISQIVFNCNTNAYATALKNSIEGSTIDGKVVTILNVNAESVTYVMGAQVRIDSIVVTYTAGSTVNPDDTDDPEVPTHEHELCEECNKCLDENCPDGNICDCSEEPETPVEGQYTLVTSVDQLVAGAKIVIVASGSNVAMSTEQKSNNRGQADVTKDNNTVTVGESVQVITLESGLTENTWAFNVDNGYLYAASSSSNHLKTEVKLSANSSWKIEIDSEGVATVKATGTNERNWMRYNKASSLFACYGSGQEDISIYILN